MVTPGAADRRNRRAAVKCIVADRAAFVRGRIAAEAAAGDQKYRAATSLPVVENPTAATAPVTAEYAIADGQG